MLVDNLTYMLIIIAIFAIFFSTFVFALQYTYTLGAITTVNNKPTQLNTNGFISK